MPKALFARSALALFSAALICALPACSGDDPRDMSAHEGITGASSAYVGENAEPGQMVLASMIEPLFDGELPGESRAFILMKDGKVIAERYGEGFSAETPLVGWSLSKSVTAVLVGILVTDGRLALDEPAPVSEWSSPGDPRGQITLRHLLNMASGLDHDEGLSADGNTKVYDGDTARMLYLDGSQDMAAYAELRPLESAPGTKFEYSTPTTMILSDIIADSLTDSRDPAVRRTVVSEFASGRLFDPLHLDSMQIEYDPAGTMVGAAYIHANAHDWARFGEFLRNNGSVAGAQIVPGSWLRFMKAPSPANAGYGGHIWRNVPRTDGGEQLLFPDLAPASMIAGLGHYGQYLFVSPEQRLTLVRLGMNETEDLPLITRQLGRIMALFGK